MRREDGCKQYLMGRGSRCMKYMLGRGMIKKHMMPMVVNGKAKLVQQHVIHGTGPALLLSETSLAQSKIIDGTGLNAGAGLGAGFGVKTPSKDLLRKLDNLSVGKKRKNVNIEF